METRPTDTPLFSVGLVSVPGGQYIRSDRFSKYPDAKRDEDVLNRIKGILLFAD